MNTALTPLDRATTSTAPGLTTLLVDRSLMSTSNLVIDVIITVLAIVAVSMISALVIILAFILSRRRKDQRKLHDVPHTVTSQLQNLDNTGGRGFQHSVSLSLSNVVLEMSLL